MLGKEDKDRRAYLRSVSWTEGSPTKRNPRPQTTHTNKSRPCLPLSISRRSVEEWPKAGSDDIGVWPNPPTTPGARFGSSIKPLEISVLEPPEIDFLLKKDKLAFFDKECSRIADHIYLGGDAVAKNREILNQNGITHVLNCVGFVCPEYFKTDLVYKTLWLKDTPSEDITSILYDVFDYFEDVRENGGRVLVHCCQGVSRSTSLVIAYLMWREGQSFEDAFRCVKAARGVTNPNMGFACQLLLCQKRVHAAPTSPNSMLRMYRIAPHSPYDPLHLVPKMLDHADAQALDSRGAFIVHIPSAIFIWIGKKCVEVMSDTAKTAASQVVRYERAQGPIMTVEEGKETSEFWHAFANNKICAATSPRKVDEYDLDFEIFQKALSGGVVPPFPLPGTISETHLPARDNGWCKLRKKFADGVMKDFITSTKLSCEATQLNHDVHNEVEAECPVSPSYHFSSPSLQCGSPNLFSPFQVNYPNKINNTYREEENCIPLTEPLVQSTPSCGSPEFTCKSPLISPSTSDYSSPFTFSPSSSNWSDFSSQSSPSGLELKSVSPTENTCFRCKGSFPSIMGAFLDSHGLKTANTCAACKVISHSIAEHRGTILPPLMRLHSTDDSSQVPMNLVKSRSFSLPNIKDVIIRDIRFNQYEEPKLDASNKYRSGMENKIELNTIPLPVLYQWPNLNKVEIHETGVLDSKSVYITLIPDASYFANNTGVLYIWLGHDVAYEKERSKKIDSVHWETIGREFLDHVGMQLNCPIQIVREGEEPEQLVKYLSQLRVSLQKES